MDKQAEIERIKQKYAERNKEIEKQHRKEMARIIGGGVLQGASALPIFNIPYVGTGIGGALFETGNAIMQGKNAKDIAKDAGKGFVVGETVGAIPYVGKVAGKTKAGQAVANQASNFANRLAETKIGQKVAEIAPRIEDVLMTDIKAFNPNKQTAYHGSPYDFAKFSNESIGTGEGAQAHGMGHYTAKSKDVADKRYRKRLTTSSKEEVEIDNRYKPLFEEAEKKYDNLITELYKQKKEGKITEEVYQNAIDNSKEAIEVDNILASWEKEVASLKGKKLTPNEGQLYKLSIPKDDVMLREDLLFSEQPLKVQKALDKIYNTYLELDGIPNMGINTNTPAGSTERALHNYIYGSQMKGGDLYRLLNDYGTAHKELNSAGIKGISYNGGIDGEARVIFNPNDIEIVRKYYNQPTLNEIINKNTNMGAFMNALMQD
jgi:hypothetical protein